jgi:DNA-binding GntR family transcriptional regulator
MPVPDRREPVQRHLLRDTAYGRLREAIVAGTLAPGEALHDDELCAWLGVSRTPVRDALRRLSEEGLVELAAQRYTRVAALRVSDVHEVVPLLAAVHGLATELAVPRLSRAAVAALHRANAVFADALRDGDGGGAFRADEQLHDVFVQWCGNPEISHVLGRLTPRLHRVQTVCRDAPMPSARSVAQHEALITRAETGDAPGAASAARANWMTLGGVLVDGMAMSAADHGAEDRRARRGA